MATISFGALIFDLDGTLLDSFRDIEISLNILLKQYSLRSLADDEVRPCIGRGVTFLVEQALRAAGGREVEISSAVEAYRRIYREHAQDNTVPYPGAFELLESLSGYPMAVLSNKPVQACRSLLEHFSLAGYFRHITGGDSYEEMKPSALPVLRIAEELGVTCEALLIVGDSTYDIVSGKAAGVRTCAITHGFQELDALLAESPDYVVADLFELQGRLIGN